jgi:hypothetical protein
VQKVALLLPLRQELSMPKNLKTFITITLLAGLSWFPLRHLSPKPLVQLFKIMDFASILSMTTLQLLL